MKHIKEFDPAGEALEIFNICSRISDDSIIITKKYLENAYAKGVLDTLLDNQQRPAYYVLTAGEAKSIELMFEELKKEVWKLHDFQAKNAGTIANNIEAKLSLIKYAIGLRGENGEQT